LTNKDGVTMKFAVARLQQQHGQPFFLAAGFTKPHLPWNAPQRFYDMHPLDEIKLPELKADDMVDIPPLGVDMAHTVEDTVFNDHQKLVDAGWVGSATQGYLATLSYADMLIGMVLDALDASPYKDNTIVVLWGDHGWHLGEKEHWRKHALWEEATNTSLIYVVPGVTDKTPNSGAVSDAPVSLMSIYPTLVKLTGVPDADAHGDEVTPLLSCPNLAWDKPVLSAYKPGNYAVRDTRYRYIRYSDGSEELYDHQEDPKEWDNRADDPALAEAKAKLLAVVPKDPAPTVGAPMPGQGD
jgi:arylsulfatase A-like enzyme